MKVYVHLGENSMNIRTRLKVDEPSMSQHKVSQNILATIKWDYNEWLHNIIQQKCMYLVIELNTFQSTLWSR